MENLKNIGNNIHIIQKPEDYNLEKSLDTKFDPKFEKNEIEDDRYQSISLPSGFIFYDFDVIKIRKFEFRDLAKMVKVTKTESFKLYKEVIQSCINVDINLLTPGDFKYICYWLRLNSYPKSPMTIEWVSKYGNKNITKVLKDNIVVLAPDITKESLKEWSNEGFQVPTIKFSNIFDNNENIDEEQEFLYNNAQYFKGDTWDEKIKNLENYINKNGIESMNKIIEFDKLCDHGVQEELTVIDSKFDPNEYKEHLKSSIKKLKLALANVVSPSSDEAVTINLLLEKAEEEYNELVKKINNKEVIQAEPETIFLEMDASELLSPILSNVS